MSESRLNKITHNVLVWLTIVLLTSVISLLGFMGNQVWADTRTNSTDTSVLADTIDKRLDCTDAKIVKLEETYRFIEQQLQEIKADSKDIKVDLKHLTEILNKGH